MTFGSRGRSAGRRLARHMELVRQLKVGAQVLLRGGDAGEVVKLGGPTVRVRVGTSERDVPLTQIKSVRSVKKLDSSVDDEPRDDHGRWTK